MPAKVIRRLQVACKAHAVWRFFFDRRGKSKPVTCAFQAATIARGHCFSQDDRWCRELGVEVFKRMGGWAHPKITIRLELEPDMKGLLPVEQYFRHPHGQFIRASRQFAPALFGARHCSAVSESNPTIHASAFSLRHGASESKVTKSSHRRARGATPSKH